MSDDHASLLQRIRNGDISAVQNLLQNHQRDLFRLAYSLLLDASLARIAVQDALLAAIYTPGKHPANEPFEIWLGSLVVRASHGQLSKRALIPYPTIEPDQDLWKAFREISGEYQFPLVLRYFHGYSIEQIARLMRVGQNTVRSRLGSGRSSLMKVLYPSESALPATDENTAAATIGHDQARFLLQSATDEHLSAQEWVPLQSHLDHCEPCRTYRRKLQSLERDIQRTLRGHLEAPGDMPPLDPEKLLARQRAGMRTRSVLVSIGKTLGTIGTLALGLFLAYIMFIPNGSPNVTGTLTADAVYAARIPPTITPSPTPPIEVPFRTPLVFESNRDGNAEIYLFDTDGQIINLTHNPAADTAPIWSADGEWVAFLSDRTGKNEIFLIHVSGTRLVQITDEPGVQWQAPLSWSGDGTRLAISGSASEDNNHNWIYLIDLTHANEVARLSFSRDAYHPRWAPQGNLLAYERSSGYGTQVFTRRVDSSEAIGITDPDSEDGEVYTAPEASFDWSPLSEGLVFVRDGPYAVRSQQNLLQAQPTTGSELMTTTYTAALGITGNSTTAWQAPEDSQIISASWSVQNLLAFLITSKKQCAAEEHWQIMLATRPETSLNTSTNTPVPTPEPRSIPRLCAAAPLTDFAWSPDGRWLVLQGVSEGDAQPALYALDVLKTTADLSINPLAPLPLLRLTEPTGNDSRPQVRPQAAQLGLNPESVKVAARLAPLPPTDLSTTIGKIVFSAEGYGNSEVYAANPDGSARMNLTQNLAEDEFLAVQKQDANQIAFFSNRISGSGAPPDVFVMNAMGQDPQQVTSVATDPKNFVPLSYSNFSWSPDGSKLAAELFTTNGKYLAILPGDPEPGVAESVYLSLQGDIYTAPLWMDNGKKIYMAASGGYSMGLLIIDLGQDGQQTSEARIEALRIEWPEANWGRINDMIHLPETNQLAFLATQQLPGEKEATLGVFVSDMRGEGIRLLNRITVLNQQYQALNAEMAWLPDMQKILVRVSGSPDQKYKGFFILVDAATGDSQQLWQTEDYVFHQVLSPDTKWLLYNTETGLWALNIAETLAATSRPVPVLDEWVSSFDWRP